MQKSNKNEAARPSVPEQGQGQSFEEIVRSLSEWDKRYPKQTGIVAEYGAIEKSEDELNAICKQASAALAASRSETQPPQHLDLRCYKCQQEAFIWKRVGDVIHVFAKCSSCAGAPAVGAREAREQVIEELVALANKVPVSLKGNKTRQTLLAAAQHLKTGTHTDVAKEK